MEQVGLNLLSDLYSDKIAAPVAGSGDQANSLFRSLLERSSSASKGGDSLTEEKQKASDDRTESQNVIGSIESMIRRIGLPSGRMKLPQSALPELVSLLEKQGFQKSEIQTLIASVSDKDGSIRLDRLLSRLQKTGRKDQESKDLLVEAKEIPLIGEALMAMGMGVGKVKEVIEGALNQKGELSLERLSGSLAGNAPGLDAKTLLSTIVERSKVQGVQKNDWKGASDPDVKELMRQFAEAPGEDARTKIKEELGRLLREKGVQPQEVKGFLEALTVDQAGALAKKAVATDLEGKKAESDAKTLMTKVVLESDAKVPRDEWRDRILQALQKEKALGKETLDKVRLQEEGTAKTADQAKIGELKGKALPQESPRAAEPKGKTATEHAETAETRKEKPSEAKTTPIREGITADISSVRIQKETPQAASVSRTGEAVALPDPLPKILDRMLWMIQGGEQKGRIQISPPELGRVDLDLVIKQGHLQAQLSAESPQVKDLLEANLNQLKQQLADIGLIVDRFDVSVGLEQNPFAREQTWTAGHQRNHSSGKEKGQETPLQAEPAVIGRAAGTLSQSQVDMLV